MPDLQYNPPPGVTPIPSGGFVYYGTPNAAGSWRTGIVGGDFVMQSWNGSAYITNFDQAPT